EGLAKGILGPVAQVAGCVVTVTESLVGAADLDRRNVRQLANGIVIVVEAGVVRSKGVGLLAELVEPVGFAGESGIAAVFEKRGLEASESIIIIGGVAAAGIGNFLHEWRSLGEGPARGRVVVGESS